MVKMTNVLVLGSFEGLAARERDLDEFVWYEFRGSRKRKVQQRNHTRDISAGTIYGLRPKRGGDYYLIFPDMYHVDFPVPKRIAENMVKQSAKKRTKPRINNLREGRQRAVRISTKEVNNRDSDRFKPKPNVKARDEKTQVDLSKYQWRRLQDNEFRYNKTQKIGFTLKKGNEFGCRFINANKGGVIVFDDGTRFRIPTVQFDELMSASKVMPLDKWRKHTLSESDLAKFESDKEREKQRALKKQQEERKQLRMQREIKKRQEANKLKEERRKKREAEKQKIKDLQERSPKAPVSFTPVIRKDRIDNLADSLRDEDDNLIDNINKIANDAPDLDLEDLDVSRLAREDTEVDENEIEIADADQDAVDEALDKEISDVAEERDSSMFGDEDDEDDVDFDDEDEDDEEEDLEEVDEEEPDLEDINAEEEQEEALDSAEADEEYEDIDSELDEDTDEVDEDGEGDEEESDDSDRDSEESSNQDQEEEDEASFEEGDVIQFHKDETDKRPFLILDIYPLKNNDRITVYKVYDIEADDETYRTVRVDTRKKATIEKMAKFVRKLNPKEFTKYYTAMDGYEKDPEPITS